MATVLKERDYDHQLALDVVTDRAADSGGYLTKAGVNLLASYDETRLTILLVRCGSGRFLAPAQDVGHFIKAVEKSGLDYVRDVSFPAQG